MTIPWERAARAVLGREREPADEGDGRQYGHKPKITLPRVVFVERELPPWFNEPIPPAPKHSRKSAGRRKTAR